MSKRRKDPTDLTANLTSLIDVTFLLIVFFVLVSKINEVERSHLELPSVPNPLSEPAEGEHRVVINVIPAPGGKVANYIVGITAFAGDEAGLAQMTEHLAGLYHTNPAVNVNVRADRTTHYEYVEPVLQAVSSAAHKAGVANVNPRVNLVVTRGA